MTPQTVLKKLCNQESYHPNYSKSTVWLMLFGLPSKLVWGKLWDSESLKLVMNRCPIHTCSFCVLLHLHMGSSTQGTPRKLKEHCGSPESIPWGLVISCLHLKENKTQQSITNRGRLSQVLGYLPSHWGASCQYKTYSELRRHVYHSAHTPQEKNIPAQFWIW